MVEEISAAAAQVESGEHGVWQFTAMNSAELSSLGTALDELTKRITAMADDAATQKREDVARELFEIERALTGASRRLNKIAEAS